MRVCMYVWMDVCMDVCMYVCMHACMYVWMYVCVCVLNHYYFLSVLNMSENFVYITLTRHVQRLRSEFYMFIKNYYCAVWTLWSNNKQGTDATGNVLVVHYSALPPTHLSCNSVTSRKRPIRSRGQKGETQREMEKRARGRTCTARNNDCN